jgi:hypothetical protein
MLQAMLLASSRLGVADALIVVPLDRSRRSRHGPRCVPAVCHSIECVQRGVLSSAKERKDGGQVLHGPGTAAWTSMRLQRVGETFSTIQFGYRWWGWPLQATVRTDSCGEIAV